MIDGFEYIGKCNCSGVLNLKYKRKEFIVYYQPKKKRFHIKEKNNYLVKNQPLSSLCEKLKSLGLTDSLECLSTN